MLLPEGGAVPPKDFYSYFNNKNPTDNSEGGRMLSNRSVVRRTPKERYNIRTNKLSK